MDYFSPLPLDTLFFIEKKNNIMKGLPDVFKYVEMRHTHTNITMMSLIDVQPACGC